MAKKFLILFLFWLLIFGLCACQSPIPADMETASVTSQVVAASATVAPALSSFTPLPSATVTPLPLIAPAVNATTLPASEEAGPDCLEQGGRLVIDQLKIEGLASLLDYRIYLPPCYDVALEQYYPVLYLVHGQSFSDDQWDRLGVDEVMDRWVASSEISPFLIVMPRDTNWGTAEQDPFDEAVLQGLIPYIDSHYRTLDDRRYRAVGGLSRGAGWAANLGLQHPELFGAVGLHSPALFWSDVPHIKIWLDAIPAGRMPRFYIDTGLNDRPEILESSRWFEALLTQRNITHDWHLFAGYHDEAYWKSHVEQYLRWYAAEW